MPRRPSTQRDHHYDTVPVSSRAVDFPAGDIRPLHHHSVAQLIYAVDGVMVVSSSAGQWVVPPTQGIWMPAYMAHTVRMVNAVTMRTLYIQPDAAAGLPDRCHTVAISGLLRQLILSAMDITGEYTADSRDGRLMALLLDELNFLPVLPLHLPLPTHPYLAEICQQILNAPDDKRTLAEWAQVVGVNAKTVQRTFTQQIGMTFGQGRQQARLLMALEQLATGRGILDVALSMGYESPSAFTAMFKKQLGVVPSEYFRLSE
jgi:AraC-like DNA-binding protein